MKRLQGVIKALIGWPLSLIALFFIVKTILPKLPEVEKELHHIHVSMILIGIGCFLLYYLFRAIVWHTIITKKEASVPFRKSTFLWSTSEIRRYIPGNIWSFLSRAMLFESVKVPKLDTAHALLIEGEFILMGLITVSLAGISLVFDFFNVSGRGTYLNILIALVILGIAAFILQKHILGRIPLFRKQLQKLASPLSFRDNVGSLLFSIGAFAMLGLGYYFSISSLVFLDPQQIIGFAGFFALSLFIGLLSFITPTGLGVREGAITIVLSRTVATSLAATAALLSRVVLVCSELLFLLLSYIAFRLPEQSARNLETFWRKHRYLIILGFCTGVYCLYFTWVSFLRYDNFYAGRFDLGNMDQTVWNTLHGRVFAFTNPNNTYTISRLAFHADFILVLLAPFYAVWSNPKMLLLIQTLVLGVGCFFVYLIAVEKLKHKPIALLLSLMYLLNPSIQRVNIFDFHPVALATTFLLGAFYFLEKKRYLWFAVFAILAALTKEQIWVIVSLFGLYIAFIQKKYIVGIGIFIATFAIFYFLVSYAIPHAGGSQHFALSYYSDFGDKPSSVIKNIVFSPGKTIATLMTKDRFVYLEQLFLPLGFTSLLGLPFLIFAGPELLINLLSNNDQAHQIYYQYSSAISPFLFIAAIFGIYWVMKRFKHIRFWHVMCYLTVMTLLGLYLYSPLPASKEPNLDMIVKQQPDKVLIDTILAHTPKRYSVAASNNIGAHLSHRQNIYTLPEGKDQADLVIMLLNDPGAQPSLAAQKQLAANLKLDQTYRLLYEKGDFIMFLKKKDPRINPL
jgi:uncharacterized membrane protein/uncharacterized membrane protein YbhN (UPF0104 family)